MATENKIIYNANDVAKYFIYLASQAIVGDSKEREGITNLKLQKILYFAQAYYLAKFGKPLFRDEIQAWAYGPVVPEVYHQYKSEKSNPIINEKDESTLSEEDKSRLQEIWNTFGGYSASRLVDITHAHAPWKEAFDTDSKIISNESLEKYYKPILDK